MKKKIYIAGCGGMLGEAFYTQFKDEFELKCTDIDVNDEWLSYMDFRDLDAYRADVLEFKPTTFFIWVLLPTWNIAKLILMKRIAPTQWP